MDRFRSILNSTFVTTYKRTIAVLFIFALTLAIPVTILLVQQRQDLQQHAAGIATISGTIRDVKTGQGVDIPGASVTLVNTTALNVPARTGTIKPKGIYSFQIFQTGKFQLGIKLPPNYTPKSIPGPIDIKTTTGNKTGLDFTINVPPLTYKDVAGRFNTACVNKLSGWACAIQQGSKKVTVKFYKGTSSNGTPILFKVGSDVADKVGKTDAEAHPPGDPVGAEKACQFALADHHVYHYVPVPALAPGDKVVGYMTGVIDTQSNSSQVQPLSPSIQMNGLQPKTVPPVDTVLPIDAPDCQPTSSGTFSISGIIFVDRPDAKGKYNGIYDPATDRPYFSRSGKDVIVQRSGCVTTNIKDCQATVKSGGKYTLSNLIPNTTYEIDVIKDHIPDPAVYTPDTTHPLKNITVNDKKPNSSGNDFGYKVIGKEPVPATFKVSGKVLVKTPSGQRPYRGAQGPATITLVDKATNGQKIKETTTTKAVPNDVVGIGSYSFDKEQRVPAGAYRVSIALPTAAQATYKILDPKSVDLKNLSADKKDVNFLLEAKGGPENQNFAISGIVYVEKSAVKDVGSEFNPGVDEVFKDATVKLLSTPSCPNNTGKCLDTNLSTKSGADGKYQFKDQASGNRYTVALTLPDGYRAATPLSRSFDLVKDRADVNFGIIKGSPPGGQSNLAISIKMPGIGLVTSNNNSPLRPNREADVAIYNSANDEVANQTTTVTYDPTLGIYKGTITLDKVPGGTYAIKARLDNTLFRFFRQPTTNNPLFEIAPSGTTTLPTLTLIAGDLDINQDPGQKSLLDVFDYDRILSCMRNESVCDASQRTLADFNDDGTLDDGRDLNILFQGLGVRTGE